MTFLTGLNYSQDFQFTFQYPAPCELRRERRRSTIVCLSVRWPQAASTACWFVYPFIINTYKQIFIYPKTYVQSSET